MKPYVFLLAISLQTTISYSQTTEKDLVSKACMNYLDGFYNGDTLKLKESVAPTLYKFGYLKNETSNNYEDQGRMTYEQAMTYSKNVLRTKRFVSEKAPKKVVVLDIMNNIASAKVTAWWGTDYMLLSKKGDEWMIEQVLWEGPLQKDE